MSGPLLKETPDSRMQVYEVRITQVHKPRSGFRADLSACGIFLRNQGNVPQYKRPRDGDRIAADDRGREIDLFKVSR